MPGKPQILYVLIGWEQDIICEYFEKQGIYVDETRDYVFANINNIGNGPEYLLFYIQDT